jgi:hypothetical protein
MRYRVGLTRHHKTNRHGTRYEYFLCAGRHERRTDCQQRAVPIDVIEDLVEAEYRTIHLDDTMAEALRQQLRVEFERVNEHLVSERARQQQRHQQLLVERDKLLQAFYAGAVTLDLLKAEQGRISRELAQTEQYFTDADARLQTVLRTLDDALDLIGDCYRAYCLAGPKLRRQFNLVFVERLLVFDDDKVTSDLAAPFKLLLMPELQQARRRPTTAPIDLQALSYGWQTTRRRRSGSIQNEPPTARLRGQGFEFRLSGGPNRSKLETEGPAQRLGRIAA